ncbi:MAG TPA: TonB family protein [Gemmatimonadaceae bacterium]|nr:TonB family protein [Gemmatimonadaceae bacterium]
MLFRRLREFQESLLRSPAVTRGLAISGVAHLVVVGGWIVTSHGEAAERPGPAEVFTPVEFLLPKDRIVSLRPQQEKVTFTSLTPGTGLGFREPPASRSEEPRLEVEVAAGEEQQIEAAEEALEKQPPIELGDSIKLEFQVDSAAVRYDDAAAPTYPESMLRRRIEGAVVVQYVVDTLGRADTATFRVLSATHRDFVRAVRDVLPLMRFRPAMMANRRVSQLVQQPFAFRIVDTVAAVRPQRPPER